MLFSFQNQIKNKTKIKNKHTYLKFYTMPIA